MSFRGKKVCIFLLLLSLFTAQVYPFALSNVLSWVSWSCIDLKVIGVCVKPPGIVGVVIMYWEPALLIETVQRPGDTLFEALQPVISGLTSKVSAELAAGITGLSIPVSSGSSSSTVAQSNLRFNEVHIYEFPFRDQLMSFVDMECPDKLPGGEFIKYLSELDFLEWRIGAVEAMQPKSMLSAASGPVCGALGNVVDGLCMGVWGPVYPRRGFITHQSEVVASAATAVRAISIAGLSGSAAHIVLEPIGFEPSFSNDKLELIYPNPSACIKIGQNPVSWESGKLSATGKYLWVYWRRRICCVY